MQWRSLLRLSCYGIVCVALPLALLLPSHALIAVDESPLFKFHVLLSMLAFAVMAFAGFLALLLACLRSHLRHNHTNGFVQCLPPVERLEQILFRTIGLGFIILSLLIVTALSLFDNLFSPAAIEKTMLSFISWAVFAVLLAGRVRFGWRGRVAIVATLTGVGLVILTYLGSVWLL